MTRKIKNGYPSASIALKIAGEHNEIISRQTTDPGEEFAI